MLSDAPLADIGLDRLGRGDFALRLARTLAERTGEHGYVVGLYGRWGEGKSTVLNFVKQGLAAYPPEQVTVVEFNPWFDSDETHLYAEFLHTVATAVGVDLERAYEKAIRRARATQKFAESIPLMDKANSVVKVATLLGAIGGLGEPTLRDFHDRLGDVFASSGAAYGRRVVVLMDDLDRLDNAQIAALFRMVKLAADFPNLCFLLAFDEEVVAEALGTRYRSAGQAGGREFLEKIINAPLRLPHAVPAVVAQVLRELLEQVLVAHGMAPDPGERVRLDEALDVAVWPYMTSLRQGKRLLSKVDFALPIMAGEVNPVDQVLMEALQLLCPALYELAAKHKAIMVGDLTAEQDQKVLRRALDEVQDGPSSGGLDLVQRLFPHTHALFGNRRYGAIERQQWIRAKRVCSPSHFDRYFTYGLPTGDILDSEITAVIDAEAPSNTMLLRDLLQTYDAGLVIRKLAESTFQIPAESAMRLARALADTLATATIDVLFRAGSLIRDLLECVAPSQRPEAVRELLDASSAHLAAMVFAWLEAPHQDPEQGPALLSQEDVQQQGLGLAERILALPSEQLIVRDSQMGLLAYGVCMRYQPQQAEQRLTAALHADARLLTYLLTLYVGNHRVAFLSALTRDGYTRLTGLLPADAWLAELRHHFPAAEIMFAALPRSSTGKPALPTDSADYPLLAFLAAYHALDTHEPPTPPCVFEPTAESPSQFRNASPHHLIQSAAAITPFVIRSAVALPRALSNHQSPNTSTADDQTRISVLARVAGDTTLRRALTGLLSTAPWQLSSLPEWTVQGGAGRESATLRCRAGEDGEPGFSLTLRMETGRAAAVGDLPAEPGITATLDLFLRLPKDQRRLTLDELRDLLLDALQLHRAMKLAALALLPDQPQSGEGVLYIASTEDLGRLIDMDSFGPGGTARSEIPVHYRIPLRPSPSPVLQLANAEPSPEAQVAVEMIKRSLLWTERQNYAPALNQLLRSASR